MWRLVSGSPASAAATLHLADNGFRAAVGRESDRGPLLEFLEALRARGLLQIAVDHILPDSSKAVEMELGASEARSSLFYHDSAGRLTGLEFIQGQPKFMINFGLRRENLREVWLELLPAVEEPPGPPRWVVSGEGQFSQVPAVRRRVFEDLRLSTAIPEGGFLLLGPTAVVYDLPYLARPFFIETDLTHRKKAASQRESVYVISPIIRSSQLRPGAPGVAAG